MLKRAVVDTGPLVAMVRRRESDHLACLAALKSLRTPMLTCWAVLTEAAWLLRDEPGGLRALDGLVQSGAFRLVHLDEIAMHRVIEYMGRYADMGAQLADAALMDIAEQEGIDTVFTLDRRDFSIYRTTSGQAMEIVPGR